MSSLGQVVLQAFITSFFVSLALVLTKHWHGRYSLDSDFGVQKLHKTPTPRVGGLAILLGLMMAYAVSPPSTASVLRPLLLAGLPAFAAGFYEDLTKRVSVRARLLATMASGVLAWALTGVAMRNTGITALDALLVWTPLAVLFTAFAVGGVANAINIIDGFNGLAAGATAIMFVALGLIALRLNDIGVASVAFTAAAAAVGFGLINWPFGKIFLGDGGAYLLGFVLAWLAVLLPMRHPDQISAWTTLLACSYPVIEVAFSVRRRLRRRGHHPGEPDRAHLHHFLHRRVVRQAMPGLSGVLQNGLTGVCAWPCAALPAIWAVVFYDSIPMLVFGLVLAAFSYSAVYARLTQFHWCFGPVSLLTPSPRKI